MTPGNVQLRLDLNSQTAPKNVMEALVGVEVTRTDEAPSLFSLTFSSERLRGSRDFTLLGDDLLTPFTRVTLMVTVEAQPKVLIDGYIIERKLTPGGGPDGTRFEVSGEDVSVRMGQFEISLDYPHRNDFLIVAEVLLRYAVLKILPDVALSVGSVIPLDFAPMENSTDRDFLLQLAGKHGYRFYIEPGEPEVGWNVAHWGPPPLHKSPQKSLVADPGPGSNVEAIEFRNDALAPTLTYGAVSQDILPPPVPQTVPVLITSSTRDPLSEDPGLGSYADLALDLIFNPLAVLEKLAELEVRGTLLQPQSQGNLQGQEPSPLESLVIAQATTNASTDHVVVAEGRLRTSRYGQVLDAPGIVPVRGAGYRFDGLYYVEKVVHTMNTTASGWAYDQHFTLSRGGLGTTVQEVAS